METPHSAALLQERANILRWLGEASQDWMVYYSVLARMAARKEITITREQDRAEVLEFHFQRDKEQAMAANADLKGMVTVLLDKVKTMSKAAARASPATPRPPTPPSSRSMPWRFRPAGILKNPARLPSTIPDSQPTPATVSLPTSSTLMKVVTDRAISLSLPPSPVRMEGIDHGGLGTSRHTLTNVHPEWVTQVTVVSPTRSSTRQGSGLARDRARVAGGGHEAGDE
jgi:hypothetical protein